MGVFQRLNDEGKTVVLITHESDIAEHAQAASSCSATATWSRTGRSRSGASRRRRWRPEMLKFLTILKVGLKAIGATRCARS